MRSLFIFMTLAGCLFSLSACASHPLGARSQASLDAWDNDVAYDPVTGRRFHRSAPPSVQEANYQQYIHSVTED